MIKIERPAFTYPPKLQRRVRYSMIYLIDFFKDDLVSRIQLTPKFEDAIWQSLVPTLNDVFNEKCSYCESLVITAHVDHFRPKLGAINLDNKKAPDHYWWLAYEWENLYLSCPECAFS